MNIRKPILDMHDELTAYRRDMHQNPQTSFEENYASDLVARKLEEWDITHIRGIAKTGIVATIEGISTTGKSIGIRADMDALDIVEEGHQEWVSLTPGKMHGCGHDGHTTTLLGTAKYLKENNDFNGKVHLIFQPAEETGEGAKAMIDDGFLDRFPCDAMYAMHNWPYSPIGYFEINDGASMANVDFFEVTVGGRGGHASKPHTFIDPIMISAQIINALQMVVSREVDPFEPAVLSVTNIKSGAGAFNVTPAKAVFSGTVRTYCPALRTRIENRIKQISSEIANSHRAVANCTYKRMSDATINDSTHAKICSDLAKSLAGELMVVTDARPSMGGEDFGAFLQHVPGAYVKIGQGIMNDADHPCSKGLHNPKYDFNDEIIPITMEYWARLVEYHLGSGREAA